jgi:hypothetical protein
MKSDIVKTALESLNSEGNLFWEYCNGKYDPPTVRWTWFADGMGRITLVGRIQAGEDEEDWETLYLFNLTEFDLQPLKECLDDAVSKRLST